MTLRERIAQLAEALPSEESAVTLSKGDLLSLLQTDAESTPVQRDLTVAEVATETGRAPSTVRGWLLDGELDGYKLKGRDWRVTRRALRDFLNGQHEDDSIISAAASEGDIRDWRRIQSDREL